MDDQQVQDIAHEVTVQQRKLAEQAIDKLNLTYADELGRLELITTICELMATEFHRGITVTIQMYGLDEYKDN
jgi:hypothetical protein